MTYLQRRGNKYGAKRTIFNGRQYDSKYEAGVAQELDLRLKAGEIQAVEPQFTVEMPIYREDGVKAFSVKHKIDFRVTKNDGSYELIEAKGFETSDYKWRRKLLEKLWLPLHLDHEYIVIKQKDGWR